VWEWLPEIGMWVETDDNARMRSAGDDQASSTLLDARVRFSNYGERGEMFIEPRIRADAYADADDKELESDDRFLLAAGEYRGETTTLGFRADYSLESVLSSEFVDAEPDDPDVDDPISGDTGRVEIIDQDRRRMQLTPVAQFRLSERNLLRLEARLIDLEYTEQELSGRTSFTDSTVAAGIVRQVDERNEVSARAYAATYEADLNSNTTDTFGVEGEFSRPLSASWSFNLAAGVLRSDFLFVDQDTLELVDNADANFSYRLGFRKRTERHLLNLDINRRFNPSATGYVVQRDEIRAYSRRRFSERLTGSVAVRLMHTETLDQVSANDERDYGRLELGMEWAMTPTLLLDTAYHFTSQEFVNEEVDEATSNMFRIGLNYRGLSQR
jgi:hypothetical protein